MGKKWISAGRRILALAALMCLSVCVPAAGTAAARLSQDGAKPANPASKKFSWSGSCTIQCGNGRCEPVCGTGVVYTDNLSEAKVQAEAQLRAEASSKGTVVEGTVTIKVDF